MKPKQPSPPGVPAKSNNQAEQLKVNLTDLSKVILRPTIKQKANNDETTPVNGSTATTTTTTTTPLNTNNTTPVSGSANGKLANRFSIFENQNQQPAFTKSFKTRPQIDTIEQIKDEEETQTTPVVINSSNKPLPPVPPSKPPRPTYNPPIGKSDQNQTASAVAANMLVKLRPVSTNLNTNQSNKQQSNIITNENNVAIGIKLQPASINSNNSNSSDSKPVTKTNSTDQDKRSSVKEIVQMLSEESKV